MQIFSCTANLHKNNKTCKLSIGYNAYFRDMMHVAWLPFSKKRSKIPQKSKLAQNFSKSRKIMLKMQLWLFKP